MSNSPLYHLIFMFPSSQNMDDDEYKEASSRKRVRGSYYSRRYRPRYALTRYVAPRKSRNSGWIRPVHKFKQTITGSSMLFGNDNISQVAAAQNIATYFTLLMCGNSGQITSLYDVYRIRKIVFKMYPQINFVASPDTAALAATSGCIATLVDTDDGTALANLAEHMQYDSCRVQSCHTMKPIIRTFVPKTQGLTYDGASQVGTSVNSNQWIDCGVPGARYYGVKIFVEPRASAGSAQIWRTFADIYIECKDVR